MRALWLVGMMGSGKTTVGETVVRRLGLVFIDTDSHIESENQRSIAVIWETEGENAFRDLESELLVRLGSTGQDCVVATGGGVVLRPENIAVMRETGTVVWLTAEPGELAGRVSGSPSRPLLRGGQSEDRLRELAAEREAAYSQAAHYRVDTSSRGIDEIAREVMKLWNGS
jgi:shikimate kinase